MFSQRCMYDTTIEKDFRCIRDAVELFQCFIELIVVVPRECCYPSLDFLFSISTGHPKSCILAQRTCFRDILIIQLRFCYVMRVSFKSLVACAATSREDDVELEMLQYAESH